MNKPAETTHARLTRFVHIKRGKILERCIQGNEGVSLHGCKASTQRRQPPSCIRSKASLMSSSVMVWVMYSSTLISCSICGVEMPINVMFNYSFYITVEGRYLVHVLVDEPRNLGATLEATERSPLPNTSSHKLERPRAYLLTRSCHTYDN